MRLTHPTHPRKVIVDADRPWISENGDLIFTVNEEVVVQIAKCHWLALCDYEVAAKKNLTQQSEKNKSG